MWKFNVARTGLLIARSWIHSLPLSMITHSSRNKVLSDLQERATRRRPSVEKPLHLSSLSSCSMWPRARTSSARSSSVTTMRRSWSALRHSSGAASSATHGRAYAPQSSGMSPNMAARGFPLTASDSSRGNRASRRAGDTA
uniref:Coronatine-insensitive protein 1 n=1 Tax=Arundo donax TaxID=35708 RepID=A0A0A9D376_ARUDO